jgi:hypothetical protein
VRGRALALLLLGPSPAAAQAVEPEPTGSAALLDALVEAWDAGDVERYLGLWSFADPAAREEERRFFQSAHDTGAQGLIVERPAGAPAARRLRVATRFVAIQEPRGRVEQHLLVLERRAPAWVVVERQPLARIDGLVHLSLDPAGFRADGLSLRLEDFELRMRRGSLFLAPESLGPTVAVFVGDGSVLFQPHPPTEQEQLRQFLGKPAIRDDVKLAFIRIHPADLARVLVPARLVPDPEAASRWAAAQAYFDAQAPRAFVLDASLVGSPWWVMPGLGDSLVAFDLRRRGTLTFAINADQPESISLFDRNRRLQICLYPGQGKGTRYSEDDGREVDLLHHDLKLRFDPASDTIEGDSTLTLRPLSPVATVRLKLEEPLEVQSVSSTEAGRHLFFRVRHQNLLMVSLGGLAGSTEDVRLRIRYSGRLPPVPVESELLRPAAIASTAADGPPVESVDVYSNRTAFYPQGPSDDYATATLRLDVPAGLSALAGGERLAAVSQGGRTLVEYRQERPGKYISVAVGRLLPVGERRVGDVTLSGYALGRTRGDSERALEQADDMLRYFSELFGPCPYERINLAVIEGEVPGGHSPPGMVVLARRPPFVRQELREDPANFSDVPGFFLAHELAHQWWGHGVAGQNYRERWLSEGFAQFAAALWTRRAHGEDRFREVMQRMGRWAERKAEWGPISLGYRLGHLKGQPEVFRALVYNKAAYTLYMLQDLIGPEVFRGALADFQRRFRFSRVGTDDLREALEAAAGLELRPYFDQWIDGTLIPTLRFDHSTASLPDGYRTSVSVQAEHLPGPLPLEVSVQHREGRATRRVTLPKQGGTFSIETPTRPRRVELNRDRGLLVRVEKR